jgi:hypothetical protein
MGRSIALLGAKAASIDHTKSKSGPAAKSGRKRGICL